VPWRIFLQRRRERRDDQKAASARLPSV
jgi:hypothetical protein